MVKEVCRCLGLGLALVAAAGPTGATAQQRSGPVPEGSVPVLPVRKALAPTPQGPPSLPAEARELQPATLRVLASGGPDRSVAIERTVTRTADRVHIEAAGEEEWLFVRNARDPRRVLGYLIDHAHKTAVVYDESDLRNSQQIRGWLDVLTLGFDVRTLEAMRATGETARLGGVAFSRFSSGPNTAFREVWWSQAELLPLKVEPGQAGGRLVSLESVRRGIDAERLRLPEERFPDYRVVDLADWLEER
jgi:hypothetical protein